MFSVGVYGEKENDCVTAKASMMWAEKDVSRREEEKECDGVKWRKGY